MPKLPTTNPFENLFGDQTNNVIKSPTPTKKNIPQTNPFEGLFEAKTQPVKNAMVVQNPIAEQKKTTTTPFGLPESSLSAVKKGTVKWKAPLTAMEKEKAYEKTPVFEQKSVDFVYNELKNDPSQTGGFLGTFKNTFLPTKAIQSGESAIVNKAKDRINAEYQQEHPVLSVVAQFIAAIANYRMIGALGGGLSLASKTTEVAGGLSRLYPTLTRAIGLGLQSGAVFGITDALSEALDQAKAKQAKPVKLLTETAKGFGTGAFLGASGALPKLGQRVLGGGTVMGGLSTLEALIQDGKIDSKDLTDIAVNTLIGMSFELVGGTKKTEMFKKGEMQSIAQEHTIQRILSNHPEMPRADAEKWAKILVELDFVTKSGIYQTATPEMMKQYQGIPENFFAQPKEVKSKYFSNVSNEVINEKTFEEAIKITNEKMGFKVSLIDNFNKTKEQVSTPVGQQDEVLIQKYGEATEAVKSYQEANKENVVSVQLPGAETPIATIDVVKNDDGKWAYSIDVNTTDKGLVSDFLSNKLSTTKEQAISFAKDDLLTYIRTEIENVSAETQSQFEYIVKNLEKPAEIKIPKEKITTETEIKEVVKPVSKEEELINELQTHIMSGDTEFIDKMKAKAENNPQLRSVLADAIATAQARVDEIRNKVIGGTYTEAEIQTEIKKMKAEKINDDTKITVNWAFERPTEMTIGKAKKMIEELSNSSSAMGEDGANDQAEVMGDIDALEKAIRSVKETPTQKEKVAEVIKEKPKMPEAQKEQIMERIRKTGKYSVEDVTPKEYAPAIEKTDIADQSLVQEAKNYKSAEEFVKAQEKETITLYRAAPKFPSDKFEKGMYFADDASKARYYSESHYKGNPSDIKVEQFTLPKNSVFKEPSTGNYITTGEASILKTKSQLTDIWNKANQTTKEVAPKPRFAKTKEGLVLEAEKPKLIKSEQGEEIRLEKVSGRKIKGETVGVPIKPIFSKTKFLELVKNTSEFVKNPVFTVIEKPIGDPESTPVKLLSFEGKERSFNIRPSALGLVEANLEVGQKVTVNVESLKAPKTEIRVNEYKGGVGSPYALQGQGQANKLFSEGTPVLLGGIDSIKPIQTPEMVELVKQLTGNVPLINKRLRTKLGVFWGRGMGEIQLRPDIFKDPVQVAKTLAHEIGHLTDWLPRFGGKRTSLLQKLYILKNHLKEEFGTELVKNKDIKNELWGLSTYWRPLGDKPSPGFLKYRNSGNELYADAISVLFNSPGLLEQKAPMFYKQFFATLENKPSVNEKYWEIQDMLHGAKEELYQARENRIKKGFSSAEDIQKGFEDKKKKADGRLGERLRQQLDNRYYPDLKKVHEAEAQGKIISDNANPKYLLQELPYVANDNYLFIDKLNKEVSVPIKEAGMNDDDIGIYLLLKRIATERKDIANPYGFDVNTAEEQLGFLKQRVGEENFKLLQEKVTLFHEEVFKSVEKAVEVGSYNKELFETTIKPNKENYATFAVVDHLQDYVPATIKKQVGTFKEVANPYHLTILKTAALNKLNTIQEAKNSMIDLLSEVFPDEIERSKEIRSGKISIFKVNKDRGQLQLLEDGKLKSYDVDPYIAKSFEFTDPDDLNVSIGLLRRMNQSFKSLVTTYNLGFAVAFNPIRDFKRNYKNIKNATILNLVKAYTQSLPSAARYARGTLDEVTKQMVEDKLISAPMYDYNFDPRDDGMGAILEKYGIISRSTPESKLPESMVKARKFLLKPVIKLMEAIRFTANTFENISKIAGMKVRIAGGETGKGLAYNVRNFTGTPNWKVKGTQTETTNEVFIFSNIMKEGLKSDFLIAFSPKTRSGYWWKTMKMDIVPKFLMFLASAGVFGLKVKEMFDKMSEYDKTNYITIPLGERNGKVAYSRIPHDETGRLISAIFWKVLNSAKDGNAKGLQDIVAFGAGQMPNVTPVITILQGWGQYLSGKNPYDSFRGRTIIDDTTFQAGGMAGLKKMVQWTANTFGLSQFTTYSSDKNDTLETAVQILPLINRVIKISDYGLTEQSKELQNEIKTERARELLKEKDVISKYVKKNQSEWKAGNLDIYEIGDQVVRDILGHDPETDEEYDRDKSIRTKLTRAMKIGAYDARFDSLIYSTSNKEKVALLKKYQETMKPEDFIDLIETAYDEKVISGEVYDQVQ